MRHKFLSRLFSMFLALCMLLTCIPAAVMAAETDTATTETSTEENSEIVLSYAKQIAAANTASSTSGGFSWDTEGKTYSWAYFNGLMMDAFLMTGDSTLESFAESFYNANIDSDGTIANYTTGALDSVEAARALFDLLDGDNADKYKSAIQYVYTQLESQTTYSDCGGNYQHKQDSEGNASSGWDTYNIALDSIYMAQPFLVECANAIDAGTLTLTDSDGNAVTSASIYEAVNTRLLWIAENLYNSTTSLYDHAYSVSGSATNGVSWSRGIGWYAMALVDIIEMMPSDYQSDLILALTKVFSGMLAWQDETTGLWYNVPNNTSSTLETSGSAMMAYALMKAYNKGYVGSAYGEAGLNAFNGIVENKVTSSSGSYTVADIYLKSGVGTTASYYETNGYVSDEAKGTAPLIMAATVANAAQTKLDSEADTGDSDDSNGGTYTDSNTGVTVTASGITGITVTASTNSYVETAMADIAAQYTAYDIAVSGDLSGDATVTLPIPEGYDTSLLAVYYVSDDGETVTEIENTVDGSTCTFTTDHFSTYVLAETSTTTDWTEITVTTEGETTYTMSSSSTTSITSGSLYVVGVADNSNNYALGTTGTSLNNDSMFSSIVSSDVDGAAVWTFTKSGNGYKISQEIDGVTYYLYAYKSSGSNYVGLTTSESSASVWTLSSSKLQTTVSSNTVSLRRSSGGWGVAGGSAGTITLYPVTASTTEGTTSTTYVKMTGSSATAYTGDTVDLTDLITVYTSSTGSDSDATTVDLTDSNITLAVDGSETTSTTLSSSSEGTYTVTAYYAGIELGTVTVTFEEEPEVDKTQENWGLEEATNYPEYPEDGAVRINKTATNDEGFTFQETGVTKVEMDVAGISVKTGIDVILVVDVSNSMGWSMDWADDMDDTSSASDANKIADIANGEQTKLDMAMDSTTEFANILLGDNTDDGETNNSLTFVTFAGYDADNTQSSQSYIDSVQTAFLNVQDVSSATTTFSNTKFTGLDVQSNGTSVKYTLQIGYANGSTASGENRGNTNYDYAFWQASQAAAALKTAYADSNDGASYDDSGREIYVVFMTDGAASHYNGQRANGSANDYLPGTTTVYPSVGYYATSQGLTNNTENWLSYMNSNDNTYANNLYALTTGGFYAVGFDLANGGFGSFSFTEEELTEVLEGMVTDATIPVSTANSATDLNEFYTTLANTLKYAGTYAEVTDTIDSDFTLLLGSSITTVDGDDTGVTNQIQVIAYDLYTSSDGVDDDLIGTRKTDEDGNYVYTVIETVTFNEDGTEAYSNLIDDGETNIMTTDSDRNVTISAYYFTYTNIDDVETFSWSIGNITDKEIALSFYVYLKNAAGEDDEGADAGTYYTNESATLEYVDINGCYATQTFPIPAVTWGSAGTTVEYYLVNSSGQPVNYNGDVIPFANRIIVGTTYTVTFNYNVATTVYGSAYTETCGVSSYEMYSPSAYYTVEAQSDGEGSLTITDSVTADTTTAISTILVSSSADGSYVASQVAFGVILPESVKMITPVVDDTIIVVDYGKSIDIDLSDAIDALEKDGVTISIYDSTGTTLQSKDSYTDVSVELVGLTTYHGKNVGQSYSSYVSSYTGSYGQFTFDSSDESSVTYQLTTMNFSGVEAVYAVFRITDNDNTSDYFYACGSIYVVPATSVYYEAEDFVTFTAGTDASWTDIGTAQSGSQDDGTVGTDAPYGYDSSYINDTTYSNGAAKTTSVASGTAYASLPTATFTFTGTGFDIYSNTNSSQSMIRVDVYAVTDGETATTATKTASVLNTGDNSLYQIPVLSIEDLEYGTYYVVVHAYGAYTNTTYTALNRGEQTIIDAVRVIDPAQGNETAEAAYATDMEANAVVKELRNAVIDAGDYDATSTLTQEGVLFLDPNGSDGTVVSYEAVGPNNEIYFANGSTTAAGFILEVSAIPESVQIGAKSANGESATLSVAIGSASGTVLNQTVTTATAMNYEIPISAWTDNGDGTYQVYLYVSNAATSGDGVLSVTDLKVTFASSGNTAEFKYNTNVVTNYTESSSTTDTTPTISAAEITTSRVRYDRNTTIEVTTTTEITDYSFEVSLGGRTYSTSSTGLYKLTVSSGTENDNGTYTYTLTLKPYTYAGSSSSTFTIYLMNSDGEYVSNYDVSARIYLL